MVRWSYAQRQRRRLGRRPIRSERRDDLLQKLVIEIIRRPSWDLLALNMLAKLGVEVESVNTK